MLTDLERKVLRILYNFGSGRRRMPTPTEISVKTGKPEHQIRNIINNLTEKQFVNWDGSNTNTIQILKGWEEQFIVPSRSLNTDYTRFMD